MASNALLGAVVIAFILILIIAYFTIMNAQNTASQWLARANSGVQWRPTIEGGAVVCPGYVIAPTNETGVYQCGSCLVYLMSNETVRVSCPA